MMSITEEDIKKMKTTGRQAWKNNFASFFPPCFSKCYSYRNNLLDKVRQMFFSSPPPLLPAPFFGWSDFLKSTAEKPLEKKTHTQSQALEVSGAEDYRSSNWLPLSKLQLHKRWYSVSAQGSKGLFPVLKNDAGLEKTQLCCDQPGPAGPARTCPPLPPTLRPVGRDANLLQGVITECVPMCICHLGMIYCQGIPFVTSCNMLSLFSHLPPEI